MGGELPERKPGGRVKGKGRHLFPQNGQGGEAVYIKGGLADRGPGQFLGRTLEGGLREGVSEDRVSLGKQIGGDGMGGGKILAHADGLGSLTGEEKCCFHQELKGL